MTSNREREDMRDDTLAYESNRTRLSGLAQVSKLLGILSIPLVLAMGVGVPVGMAAVVLGMIARTRINAHADRLHGMRQANIGIATGFGSGGVVLLVLMLLPSRGCIRCLSNRSVCAANLRGIMQSLVVYSADNNEKFPIVSPVAGYGLAAAGSGTPNVDADAMIRSMYSGKGTPSVTQNIWLLVASGAVAPKQFLCKDDPFGVPSSADGPGGKYFTNFNNGKGASDFSYSYSFAYPWTAAARTTADGNVIPAGSVGGWWSNTMDASLPQAADMAPLAGTGKPVATPGDGRSKSGNSFNHHQEGQNVAYGDAHAEFSRVAAIGHKNDNIYAGSKGVPAEIGVQTAGMVPDIGAGGVPGNWDVCLVPAADGRTGVRK